MLLSAASLVYQRFAYGSIANFDILRDSLKSSSALILEIEVVGSGEDTRRFEVLE